MKYGAMIVGILTGFIALSWLGLFGSIVGGVTTAFDNASGENIKALSIGLPILAMIGGAICGAQPQLGGIILLASAFGIYKFLGFNSASEIFIISIGAAGVLGLVSPASSKPHTSASLPQQKSGGATGVEFDRAKWNALLQYDKDISAAVESIRPLGAKWVDEFAMSYLALNDKAYIPEIIRKVTARAKSEAEELEQLQLRRQQQQAIYKQEQQRSREARKVRLDKLRNFFWGTKYRKLATAAVAGILILAVGFASYMSTPSVWLLTADGYGPVRIGMTSEQISTALGVPLQTIVRNDPCAEMKPVQGFTGVKFLLQNGSLASITVSTPGAKTIRGVGIGTNDMNVRNAYPEGLDLESDELGGPSWTKLTFWEQPNKLGILFLIKDDIVRFVKVGDHSITAGDGYL